MFFLKVSEEKKKFVLLRSDIRGYFSRYHEGEVGNRRLVGAW
jgi:hypothetical protein